MKNLLIVICILAFSALSFGKPAFGIRGGLNFANASHDPEGDYESSTKVGLLIGGNVEFSLSPANTTTLRFEWLYAQKGWKEEGTLHVSGFGDVDYEGTSTVDEFVLAPFIVQRFPAEGVTPFIQFGPELGLNLTAEAEADAVGMTFTEDIPDWSDMNFSINFGGGLAFPTGKGEFIIDVRYNYGLLNMYTGDADYDVKTNGIQFMAGYNFSMPEK